MKKTGWDESRMLLKGQPVELGVAIAFDIAFVFVCGCYLAWIYVQKLWSFCVMIYPFQALLLKLWTIFLVAPQTKFYFISNR